MQDLRSRMLAAMHNVDAFKGACNILKRSFGDTSMFVECREHL